MKKYINFELELKFEVNLIQNWSQIRVLLNSPIVLKEMENPKNLMFICSRLLPIVPKEHYFLSRVPFFSKNLKHFSIKIKQNLNKFKIQREIKN